MDSRLTPLHQELHNVQMEVNHIQFIQNSIDDFFVFIRKSITFRLGKTHPDVLQLSLDTFLLLMVFDSERAEEVSEASLNHARSKAVWDQRAMESVKLQEQLAWAYFTHKRLEPALEILQHLTAKLREYDSGSNGEDSLLYEQGTKISEAERIVRAAIEGTSHLDYGKERM